MALMFVQLVVRRYLSRTQSLNHLVAGPVILNRLTAAELFTKKIKVME